MTVSALLHDLEENGVIVDCDEEQLVVVGPENALTDPVLERLRSAKLEILATLSAAKTSSLANIGLSDALIPSDEKRPDLNVEGPKWGERVITPPKHVHTCIREDNWNSEDWRAFFDERAGILEYDHNLPRQAAERRAFEATIVEWLNQHTEPSDPGHCAWCGTAETSDARVVPYGTNPVEQAWLHPQCWNAWHQDRQRKAASALMGAGLPRA